MLIRNALDILSGANERIAVLGSEIIDKEGKPREPKLKKELIEVTSLYNILREHVLLSDDGDAITGTIGENDVNLNILLFRLKKAARIESYPDIPSPISSYVNTFAGVTTRLPQGSLGDLFYHDGSSWEAFGMGNDGDVLVATPSGLQWQSVVGNGIPSGGSTGQMLVKSTNDDYDAIWASGLLSHITDVTASAAEVNKLDGATWSTAESNTLLGINTGTTIQAQLDAKISGTLEEGFFFVGNASDVPTAVAPSGDVVFDADGIFTISNEVIVNADISLTASIARSKFALGTAHRLVVNDATGLMVDAAAITAGAVLISDANGIPTHSSVSSSTLAFLDASSSIQDQLDERLIVNLTDAAEGDLLYHNGTDWVNLGIGDSGYVLTSTGTSVSWGAATSNGLPGGGNAGEFLRKVDETNYNAEWHPFTLADVSDVTATSTELNLLSGLTATASSINWITGVTSSIQDQINTKLTSSLTYHAIFIGGPGNTAQQIGPGDEGSVFTVVAGHPTWQLPPTPGNVTGPVSSTDNAIVRFNGTDGDSIQDSSVLIDDSNNITGVTSLSSGQVSILNQAALRLYETGSTNYVALRSSGTMSADYTITLPSSAPASNTYLKYDGSDYVWAAAAGGAQLQQKTESGTTYSITDADDGYVIYFTNAAGCTVTMANTVTTDVSVTTVRADGAGVITHTDDGTSVLFTIDSETDIEVEYGSVTWVKNTATDWYGWGALGAAGGGTVSSVSGTTDRISSTGGTTPVIDIASTYVGQTSITTLGTIATGTWNATTIGVAKGGTGLTALGTASQLLRVNAGATALEYFTPSYISGNQTITLSGDVSGSGTTAITTTIGANVVTNAMIRQSSGLSVVGRSANSSGNVADITAGSDHNVLRRSGTSIGFGTINLASSGAVGTSVLPIANGGTGSATKNFWGLSGVSTLTGNTTIGGAFAFSMTELTDLTLTGTGSAVIDFTGLLEIDAQTIFSETTQFTGVVFLDGATTVTGSFVIPDSVFLMTGSSTNGILFNLADISASTIRTYYMPNSDGTLLISNGMTATGQIPFTDSGLKTLDYSSDFIYKSATQQFVGGNSNTVSAGSITFTFGDTNINSGTHGSAMFGELSEIDENVGAAFNAGENNYISAYGGHTMGRGIKVSGIYSWGGGWYSPNTASGKTNAKAVLIDGDGSFGFYETNGSQTDGHGVLSDSSAVLGGLNPNIPSDSPRSVILGGNAIKARATDPDQVYVPNFNIVEEPDNDDTLTQILARDSSTGEIKYRLASSLGGGGSLTDGDKGDITVASSGATMTIDNDAVTYAKIQNVASNNRILGRVSGASGDIEELTQAQVQSLLLSGLTGGATLYNNAGSLQSFGSWNGSTFGLTSSDSVGNSVNKLIRLGRITGDTPAVGLGVAIEFAIEYGGSGLTTSSSIKHQLANATNPDTEWVFTTHNNSVETNALTILTDGGLVTPRSGSSPTIGADTAVMYVNDITAGNAAHHFKSEAGHIIKLYTTNSGSAYTITNGTTDRTFDANSYTTDELADVLATLITDLKLTGLIA